MSRILRQSPIRKASAHLRDHICPSAAIFKNWTKFIFYLQKFVRKCHFSAQLVCHFYIYHHYNKYSRKKDREINPELFFWKKLCFRKSISWNCLTFSLNLKDVPEGMINESRLKGNCVCNSACCYVTTSNYTHVHFLEEETTASDD